MPHTLILLRHGQSEWNQKNLFTGWVDVRLTEKGIKEAKRAGEFLKEHDLLPDVLHTSMLSRAIQTANFALDTADRLVDSGEALLAPQRASLRCAAGQRQSTDTGGIRRGTVPVVAQKLRCSPPPIDPTDTWAQQGDPRYADIEAFVPKTESLKIVIDRMLPYWSSDIATDVAVGKVTLVVAHGNSLRGLVKHLEGISDEDIAELNIPTGIPLVYELGEDLKPTGTWALP